MDLTEKALHIKNYSLLKEEVSKKLEEFEKFCKNAKGIEAPQTPDYVDEMKVYKIYYQNLIYIDSKEKWVEFKYLDIKYRMEIIYSNNLSSATIKTFKIVENSYDTSKEIKEIINELDIEFLINIGENSYTHIKIKQEELISSNKEFSKKYIDYLWDKLIEPTKK